MAPAREAEKAGGMTKVPQAWGLADVSPLAFGADPASAGSVTKVPKAWGLGPSPCSHYFA